MTKKFLILLFLILSLTSCAKTVEVNQINYVYYEENSSSFTVDDNYDVLIWKSNAVKDVSLNDIGYSSFDICTSYQGINNYNETEEAVFLRLKIVNNTIKKDLELIIKTIYDIFDVKTITYENSMIKPASNINMNCIIEKNDNKNLLKVNILSYSSNGTPNYLEIIKSVELQTSYLAINAILSIIFPNGKYLNYSKMIDFINSFNCDCIFEIKREIINKNIYNNDFSFDKITTRRLDFPVSMSSSYEFKSIYSTSIIDNGNVYYLDSQGIINQFN